MSLHDPRINHEGTKDGDNQQPAVAASQEAQKE